MEQTGVRIDLEQLRRARSLINLGGWQDEVLGTSDSLSTAFDQLGAELNTRAIVSRQTGGQTGVVRLASAINYASLRYREQFPR